MHFNGRFVLNLARMAQEQGADLDKIISLSGKTEDELCREDCVLGPVEYNAVLEACVKETGDEFFGLHAGEHLNLQAAGLIVQIAHSSSTVEQALEYCCEFANLGCSALPTTLHNRSTHFELSLTPDETWRLGSELAVQHTIYGYLAFSIREFRSLTQNKYYPKSVWFDFPKPSSTVELERVLNCPLRFDQDRTAMLFEIEHVREPVVTSDLYLLKVLVAHATERLAQLSDRGGFSDIVKRSILQMIKPEFPTIEQVAAHLNMSVRNFQRKLSAEGHSYKALLDELRKQFAFDYLKDPELDVNEIAFLLSYSDASAFIRSFKRWTGRTPKEHRDLQERRMA